MNKLFIIILTIILPINYTSAQDIEFKGFAYNFLPEGGVELVALPDGKKYEGTIVVPQAIYMKDASLINHNAPSEVRRRIGSREICNVVKIGDRAFKDCKNLISLDLSSITLREIGKEAIAGCPCLKEIKMGAADFLSKIDDCAFMNSSCEDLSFPFGIEEIGDRVAYGMNINTLSFASSHISKLGTAAFANSTVKYVDMSLHINSIPDNTFKDCTNLKYIVLPKSISVIGANAFHGCKNLKSLSIPKKLCHIGKNAFYGVKLDCIVFNDVETTPQYTFSSICGNHIPNLIMFPAPSEKAYRKWYPKMFKKRIPLLVSGGKGFRLSNKLISQETSRVAPYSTILQNSRKNFDNDAEILINKGGNLSIIVEHYIAYGIANNKSTGTGGKGYAAMVNDKLVRLQHMYLETIIEQEDYALLSPHNLYILELKDIKSPCTININWNN